MRAVAPKSNKQNVFNPLNPELNPICYLLALLAHHFLHVSRIMVNRAKKGTKILRVCLDSYIKCNINSRSVYFATGTLNK
jgi:hypothetical protein